MLSAGVFTVTNTNANGAGSFKQAIDDANAASDNGDKSILIAFAIAGEGVHRIDLRGESLILRSDITVDGYTQPGASPNTLALGDNAVILIQLDGGGPSYTQSGGLAVLNSDVVIRGISITGFQNGLSIGDDFGSLRGRTRIEGNFIGIEPDGTTLNGNDTGIWFRSGGDDVVGGTTPGARNVIAGNRLGVTGAFQVLGNYIGTDASGFRQGYGNGVGIDACDVVGGSQPGAGNVITNNGIGISASGRIQGNLIGTYADGSASLGNNVGIRLYARGSIVGGLEPGEGNVIGYNGTGVSVSKVTSRPSINNSILSNVFPGTRFSAIDLGVDGPTPNDFLDGDSGANNLQNYPVIASVTRDHDTTTVRGGLNSAPATPFVLQFFASHNNPASQQLLGTATVTTNGSGDAFFTFRFDVATTQDDFISATATDPNGNTSEFSPSGGSAELANLSTRGFAASGDHALIGGYIFDRGLERVLIRALGPSLDVPGAISDPQLEVRYADGSLAASNRNWQESEGVAIAATGLEPHDPREAAVIFYPSSQAFAAGTYNPITVLVSGEGGSSGIATVEVYRLHDASNGTTSSAELRNISTRSLVGAEDGALIAGAIIDGSAPQKLLFRAIGPDLAQTGVQSPLQDPVLELRNSDGTLLAANDNWRSDQEQEIIESGLAPNDDRDAAMIIRVLPTAYTAVTRGVGDAKGVALVEVYAID